MQSPVAGKNALKRSKTTEGSLRAVLLGDLCAAIYLSCGREGCPRYFTPGDQDTILFFGVMRVSLVFWAVQNIAKMDTGASGWLG